MPVISDMMMRLVERQESERLEGMKAAWQTYQGDMPAALAATKSDPAGKDNVKLSFGRLIVDTGVSFLLGDDIDFEVEKEEDQGAAETDGQTAEDARDKWLDEVWDYNQAHILLTQACINGGVTGHTFLRVFPPSPQTRDYPRIIALDPQTVTPFWELDDYNDVFGWKLQWLTIDFRTGKPAVRRQFIVRNDQRTAWTITDYISRGDTFMSGYLPMTTGRWEELGTQVWPYAWSPIFHNQNLPSPNAFWGMSDLEGDVVGINHSINFILSNMARIIRHHAHPIPVGKGFSAKEVEAGVGQLLTIPTKDGSIDYLEMAGDLASSLEMYKTLKEALHSIARLPEVATGKIDNVGPLSGVALKLLYGPFVAKTRTKQALYGHMLADLNSKLLEMNGDGEDVPVEVKWTNPVPVDDKEDAETMQIYELLGVSKATLIEKLGFDAETEAKKKQKEQDAANQMDIQKEQAMASVGDMALRQFNRGQG